MTPITNGVINNVILSSKNPETFSIFFNSITLKYNNATKSNIDKIVAGIGDLKITSKIVPINKKIKIIKNS